MTLFINGVERGKAVTVTKTADETVNNSTTIQSDDELFYALEANSTYIIDAWIRFSGGTSSDFKFDFTVPSGAVENASNLVRQASDNNTQLHAGNHTGDTDNTRIDNSSVTHLILLTYYVKTGGTAGNFQFQWAQNSQVVEDTKVLAGSTLVVRKIA